MAYGVGMETTAELKEGNIVLRARKRHAKDETHLPGLITSIKHNMVRIENPHGSFWLDLPLEGRAKVVTVRGLLNEFA